MKLELKHLAPYLPYKLQWYFEGEDFSHEVIGFELNTVHLLSPYNDYGRCTIDEGKPILRPLSDLKPSDYGYVNEPFEGTILEILIGHIKSGYISNSLWLKMVKEKFDVYSLIDSGLAIDINTLKDE